MKRYTVKQYTTTEYEAYTEENDLPEYDVINIVWSKKAVCMDIMATGKRLVPILRKIEESMPKTEALSMFDGWFGPWADSLANPTDRQYFIWSYDGKQDRENGRWSYSWGIEQLEENEWYIFLNIARPEESTLTA